MHVPSRNAAAVTVLAASLTLGGCQTTGDVQDQTAGAGIGALIGAGIGAAIGGRQGALAGAAIGGLVGFSAIKIHQYQSRQVRSSSADSRLYGLTQPVSSTQVKIRRGSTSPRSVRRGQSVDIKTDYSLLLPSGTNSASVTERWTLKKDGKVVANLPSKSNRRTAGGWNAEAEITIPPDVPTGTYVIEHRVKAGSSYDTDESSFVVRG